MLTTNDLVGSVILDTRRRPNDRLASVGRDLVSLVQGTTTARAFDVHCLFSVRGKSVSLGEPVLESAFGIVNEVYAGIGVLVGHNRDVRTAAIKVSKHPFLG